jgi:hypothetical protein
MPQKNIFKNLNVKRTLDAVTKAIKLNLLSINQINAVMGTYDYQNNNVRFVVFSFE